MPAWNIDEEEYIKQNYSTTNMKIMETYLKRTASSIHNKAYRLKIPREINDQHSNPHSCNKKRDLSFLLSSNLEAFYWAGFILADGCISQNRELIIKLGNGDKSHLEKLANKIKVNVHPFERFTKGKPRNFVSISAMDSDLIPILSKKFDFKQAKTYNPPDFLYYKSNFSNEELLALIIGYIDGDGCITVNRTNISITIECHESWLDFFNSYNNFIHDYFNCLVENKVYRGNRGSTIMKIGKRSIIKGIYAFIIEHNLPVLERKWNNMRRKLELKHKNTAKPIQINNKIFPSLNCAAKFLNIPKSKLLSYKDIVFL